MKSDIVERAIKCAEYIVENNATVRKTAEAAGIGKSTVHTDIHKRLPRLNGELYEKVMEILKTNLEERHLRGGESTRKKYLRANGEKSTLSF